MTKDEWAAIARVLADAYPHSFKMTDKSTVMTWFMALADLPGERVGAAVWSMVRTQPSFPSIADVRRLAEGVADAPAEAWAEALRLATLHGGDPAHRRYQPQGAIEVVNGKVRRLGPKPADQQPEQPIADPLLAKTVAAIGGLAAIAYGDSARLDTLRAQFLKLYAGFGAEHKRQETFAALGVPATPPALGAGREAGDPRRLGDLTSGIAAPPLPQPDQEDTTP